METVDKYIIASKLRYMRDHRINKKPVFLIGPLSLDEAKEYMKEKSINNKEFSEEYCIVKMFSRWPED